MEMAKESYSKLEDEKSPSLLIRLVAILFWLIGILEFKAEAPGETVNKIALAIEKSALLAAWAPFAQFCGELFKIIVVIYRVIFTGVLDGLFGILHIPINPKYYNDIILGLAMSFLIYQFSVKSYYNLKRMNQARSEPMALGALAMTYGGQALERILAAGVGGMIGLLCTGANLFGAAIGALIGSMIIDITTSEADKSVTINEGLDKGLVVQAILLGTVLCTIYSGLILLVLTRYYS